MKTNFKNLLSRKLNESNFERRINSVTIDELQNYTKYWEEGKECDYTKSYDACMISCE